MGFSERVRSAAAARGLDWTAFGKNAASLEKAMAAMDQDEGCGLWLCGPVGVGKSTFADVLCGLSRHVVALRMTVEADRERLARGGDALRAAMGQRQGGEWLSLPRWVFVDDAGQEPTRNEYGVRSEPFGDFVTELGEMYRQGRWRQRLVVTSNLGMEAVAERYGARVADRLAEMCAVVKMGGRSLRKTRGVF